MSWTYSGDPANSDLDMVRWLIGDTDPNFPESTDEEILAAIAVATNVSSAAVLVLDSLIAKYSYQVDYAWSGDYSEEASQRARQLRSRRNDLLVRVITPATALDDDLHAKRFDVGMHDTVNAED